MSSLLSTDIITLRALEPTDIDLLYRWENDTTLWTVTDTMAPYSRQVIWQYLKNYSGDVYASHQLRLMVTLTATGETVGIIDLNDVDAFNSRAEVGLLIAQPWQGKGYAHAALAIVMNYAQNHLGLRQLYVKIPLDNEACLHVFTDCGFTMSGTLRSWIKRGSRYHDVALLQHIGCNPRP